MLLANQLGRIQPEGHRRAPGRDHLPVADVSSARSGQRRERGVNHSGEIVWLLHDLRRQRRRT